MRIDSWALRDQLGTVRWQTKCGTQLEWKKTSKAGRSSQRVDRGWTRRLQRFEASCSSHGLAKDQGLWWQMRKMRRRPDQLQASPAQFRRGNCCKLKDAAGWKRDRGRGCSQQITGVLHAYCNMLNPSPLLLFIRVPSPDARFGSFGPGSAIVSKLRAARPLFSARLCSDAPVQPPFLLFQGFMPPARHSCSLQAPSATSQRAYGMTGSGPWNKGITRPSADLARGVWLASTVQARSRPVRSVHSLTASDSSPAFTGQFSVLDGLYLGPDQNASALFFAG